MKTLTNLLAPLAVAVVLALATNASAQIVTPLERAVIRQDVRELRYDIRRAAPLYTPLERAVIRQDVRDLRWDVYRARRW
jgi:hypothetical protein